MKARQALRHGSLFAGLGGFDLGLRWAGFETVWQVEIDSRCRKVLRRHFPNAARFKDIAKCGAKDLCAVDVITGGFPCIDISEIGKRAGLAGEHSRLWWQMHRIIRELRPPWCIVENVRALRDRGADEVVDALVLHGSALEVKAQVQRYVDAGVTTPVLAVVSFGLDLRQAVRDLAPSPAHS